MIYLPINISPAQTNTPPAMATIKSPVSPGISLISPVISLCLLVSFVYSIVPSTSMIMPEMKVRTPRANRACGKHPRGARHGLPQGPRAVRETVADK